MGRIILKILNILKSRFCARAGYFNTVMQANPRAHSRLHGLLLLVCLLDIHPAQAQLQVTTHQQALLAKKPRETVSLAFTVRNGSNREVLLQEELALPEGWQLLIPLIPFSLAPQQQSVQFVSVLIPQNTRADTYRLTYTVLERQRQYRQAVEVGIEVLPVTALVVSVLKQPSSVMDGENYQLELLLQNNGNQLVAVQFKAEDNFRVYVLQPKTGRVEIEPYTTLTLPFDITTQQPTGTQDLHILNFTFTAGGEEQSVAVSLPVIHLERSSWNQRFHSVASTLAVTGLVTQKSADSLESYQLLPQVAIAGAGLIKEPGHEPAFLEYGLRAPTLSALGLTQPEEYFLSYEGERYSLDLGDRVYRLSPAIESGQFGRGIKWGWKPSAWQFGGYYVQSAAREEQELEAPPLEESSRPSNDSDQVAGYGSYAWNPQQQTRFNLLRSNQSAQGSRDLWGVQHQLQLKTLKLGLELATGTDEQQHSGQAYQLEGWYRQLPYQCSTKMNQSDAGFPGEITGKSQFAISCVRLQPRWFMAGGYQYGESIDQLASGDEVAPAVQSGANLALEYKVNPALGLSVGYSHTTEQDAQRHLSHDIVSVGLTLDKEPLTLNLLTQWGIQVDELTQVQADSKNAALTLSYRPTLFQVYGLALNYDQNLFSDEEFYGISASGTLWLNPQRALNLTAQHSQSNSTTRQVIQAAFSQQLRNRHTLSLSGYVEISALQPRNSLMLNYAIPFAMPVAPKRHLGHLRGKLYDQSSQQALAGVQLQLAERVTVTDSSGRYQFFGLEPKTYTPYLREMPSAGLSYIIATPEAAAIAIQAGQTTDRDIPLTQAAQLSGTVMAYQLKQANQQFTLFNQAQAYQDSDLVPERALNDLLVVLTNINTQETHKRLTRQEGQFLFESLRPGSWQVEVFGNLPVGYQLKQTGQGIELKPGEIKTLPLQVVPEIRAIQLLDQAAPIEVE